MGPSNSSYLSNIAIVHGTLIMGEAEYMVKPSIPEIGRFPSDFTRLRGGGWGDS